MVPLRKDIAADSNAGPGGRAPPGEYKPLHRGTGSALRHRGGMGSRTGNYGGTIFCSATIDKLATVHGWDCSHHEGVLGGGRGGRTDGGPSSSPARGGPQCLEYCLEFLPHKSEGFWPWGSKS
ncbi:hypothetical protein ACJJTC_009335 [Scirpophaga incertulas]